MISKDQARAILQPAHTLFKNVCMHYYTILSMSPCSRESLLTLLYIYSNIIIMAVNYYSGLTYKCLVLDSELSTCCKRIPMPINVDTNFYLLINMSVLITHQN